MDESPLLTIGREYLVLSVAAQPGGRVLVRLIDNEGDSPSVWDARMFTTTSTRIPQLWGIRLDDDGVLTLAPPHWQRAGFWEDYFDDNPRAVREFQTALRALQAEPD
jgi:hypothetical protein